MEFWSDLWQEIGITFPRAVGVVLSAAVLYLASTIVLRVWGQRLFANRSGSGVAVVLVLGAIVGRSMLGPNATLLGGLLVLATLLTLESIFGAGRRAGIFGHRSAVFIYRDGQFDRHAMHHFHLHENVVWAQLRKANITAIDDVYALVLETDGALSVLRSGPKMDERILTNVRDAEHAQHKRGKES